MSLQSTQMRIRFPLTLACSAIPITHDVKMTQTVAKRIPGKMSPNQNVGVSPDDTKGTTVTPKLRNPDTSIVMRQLCGRADT